VVHQETVGLVQHGEVLSLTVHSGLLGGEMKDRVRLVLDRVRGKRVASHLPYMDQGKFQVNARKNIPKEHG